MTLDKVSQVYQTRSGPRTVLRDVSLCVRPGEKIGILGRNGAGKSTLIRLMSGAELPTMGTVERRMSVSWPLAFSGAFQGSLTGLDNLRFICRIYGAAIGPAIAFVDDFAELGPYLREPVRHYSSGMRARLAFAVSLAVDFDCFLIDEIVAVGDSRFHAKCEDELFRKRADRAMVIVSHHAAYIAAHCERAAVLSDGRLTAFDGIQHAFDAYHAARPADAGGDTDTGQAAQAAQAASR